ncbi:MAG: hypothetical protein QTN59_19705 [Candidatus Electrothrix communis]|nr:MAG: hypothetical protein QTN59_19705 [Candidatus Electrothrix communis]
MERYTNRNKKNGKDSGVTHYSILNDAIEIKFKNSSKIYIYNDRITGKEKVDAMKSMAKSGMGLATYIAHSKHQLKHQSR